MKKEFNTSGKSWFTSDYHFYHANVIKYDNRPFKDVSHMNRTIIDNHNSVVDPEDNFYFLGDFSFAKDLLLTEDILKELNGRKFFIKGNHDDHKTIELYKKYGTYLGEQTMIKIDDQRIVLNHYAMRVWNGSHRGVYHLYGHSHLSLPDDPNSLSFDVGIMGNEYYPYEYADVVRRMKTKNYKPIDHHR